MNKYLLVSALLAVAMSGCGISPEDQANRERWQAEREVELKAHYKVTVMDSAGGALREWTSRGYVDISHGVAIFNDAVSGKKIRVGGNFIVEQL